jgi:hypothetical protein
MNDKKRATLAIGIFASSLILNQNQAAIAQQKQPQQLLGSRQTSNQTISQAKQLQQPFVSKDISFDIDNVTFSHHMASVNGIQIHYVIGSQGDPIVLLHGWPQTWYVLPIISLLFCFMDSIMHIRHRALGMEAKIFVILAFKIFSLASKV